MKKWKKMLAVAVGSTLCMVGTIGVVGAIVAGEEVWGGVLFFYYGPKTEKVEERYGFDMATPYIEVDGQKIEVVRISLNDKTCLGRAGFRDGDIVLSPSSIQIVRALYENSYEPVEFVVLRRGTSKSEKTYKRKSIKATPAQLCQNMGS